MKTSLSGTVVDKLPEGALIIECPYCGRRSATWINGDITYFAHEEPRCRTYEGIMNRLREEGYEWV